jgi:hypothetical protein
LTLRPRREYRTRRYARTKDDRAARARRIPKGESIMVADRRELAVRATDARSPELSPEHRDEWAALRPPDQALLTREVLARWTTALAPDEYTLADVVRLERQRRRSLSTIREGVALTDQEFHLVRLLQRHEGRTVTFAEMIRELWPAEARGAKDRALWQRGGSFERHIRALHAAMWKIKRKLELDHMRPQHLVSVRSVGYRWYSLPPSADDGEDYAARADEGRALRYEIRGHRGELPPPRENGGRFGVGPNHPDYRAVEAQVTERRSDERD